MSKLLARWATLTALAFAQLSVSAADLFVGPNRPYSTISGAIAAANDGDRILVVSTSALYAESPTITKSLTIMSATEGELFRCTGEWTFAPATAGKALTIMNMHLLDGRIWSTSDAPAGARSQIRVLGCVLINSRIQFNRANFDVTAAADSIIQGNVDIRFGKVLGNFISIHSITGTPLVTIQDDFIPTNDTVWVVGNRLRLENSDFVAIYVTSSTQNFLISNNLIHLNNTVTDSIPSAQYVTGISIKVPAKKIQDATHSLTIPYTTKVNEVFSMGMASM